MSKRYVLPAAILAFSLIAPAAAENFPTRPITWIVPFTPGGITDTTSRLVADEM
jgi:tripartite-type tricarboxylate transporter receptor subunit TctC